MRQKSVLVAKDPILTSINTNSAASKIMFRLTGLTVTFQYVEDSNGQIAHELRVVYKSCHKLTFTKAYMQFALRLTCKLAKSIHSS